MFTKRQIEMVYTWRKRGYEVHMFREKGLSELLLLMVIKKPFFLL